MINCEIEEAENAAVHFLLPAKSIKRYEKVYRIFKDWCKLKKTVVPLKQSYWLISIFFFPYGKELSNYIPLSMYTKASLVN